MSGKLALIPPYNQTVGRNRRASGPALCSDRYMYIYKHIQNLNMAMNQIPCFAFFHSLQRSRTYFIQSYLRSYDFSRHWQSGTAMLTTSSSQNFFADLKQRRQPRLPYPPFKPKFWPASSNACSEVLPELPCLIGGKCIVHTCYHLRDFFNILVSYP